MNKVINLKQESVYYLVGFFDKGFTFPSIETYIYEGLDKQEEFGHMFRSCRDGKYISFPIGEIKGILANDSLIEWLETDHSPEQAGQAYEYRDQQQDDK